MEEIIHFFLTESPAWLAKLKNVSYKQRTVTFLLVQKVTIIYSDIRLGNLQKNIRFDPQTIFQGNMR
jgi:hypothetical protein